MNDLKTLGKSLASTDTLLAVDAISGLGGQELRMDEWHLDCVVSGSQKGLMNAPGLAFVGVSPKAWKRVETAKLPRFYWDLRRVRASVADQETPFTPAVSLVAGLAESLRMIQEETLEKVWKKHATLASMAQAGMKALGLPLFSSAPCNVLTAARVPDGLDSGKLVNLLRDQWGVSIAGGQEHLKGKIIRLAHMGYMDAFDLLTGFAALEQGLIQMGHRAQPGQSLAAVQHAWQA